ncbi:YeeE/YedE thiosulfate transporter family protein [Thermodesulfatator atlanticus]|uniref:YeeE/YedE thiosulfate transporter family protein n=1 Tax=Thermodesulfatator atlanticus TaxID=501497 RepID=UPI0003B7053F|nr:YeeE/YedE thiosulfate transporter family protein [Thermodesulfatator atlanticus]
MSDFKEAISRSWKAFAQSNWSPMMGGILLAIFCVFLEAWYRPWGIVGGLRNWADWLFYGIGFYEDAPPHPLEFSSSVLNIGYIWGAMISAMLAREFGLRFPPKIEYVKAIVSGILMGLGSALAMGCNVGGYYVAIQNLAANGFLMAIGLTFGVIVGIKYLYWELEHFPSSGGFEISFRKISPYIGFLLFVGLIVATYAYFRSDLDNGEVLGGCLIITAGIGYVIHRSRFCMVNGFREPFMTGEASMGKAIMVSIIIGAIGVSILKYQEIRPEMMYVTPTFGLGALLGGFIFGAAMVVAGGCGSGALWRVAEGQIKLWVVAFFFALSNSLIRHYFAEYDVIENGYLGKAVFMPEYLGYGGTLFLITLICVVWYIIIDWNEDSNKMVIEM